MIAPKNIDDHAKDRVRDICDELLGRAEELEAEASVLRKTVEMMSNGGEVKTTFGFAPTATELEEDGFVQE